MMHRMTALIAIVLCCCTFTASSQWWKIDTPEDVSLFQVGMSINAGYVMHSGDIILPQAPTCCGGYTSAQGIGPALSLFVRQELGKAVRLTLRGTYATYDGVFEVDQAIFVTNATEGITRHTLDARLGWLGGEFLVDWRIASPVRLMLGGSAGFMSPATFSQRETLIIPGTGTFENGRRTRNEISNEMIDGMRSPLLGAVVGVGLDIPMTENHSVVLTPEVLYTFGLNDLHTTVAWKANALRVGASLAFSLNAPVPPMSVERKSETFIDSLIVDVAPDAIDRRAEGVQRVVVDTVVGEDLVTITDRMYRTDTVFRPLPPKITAAIAARAQYPDGSQKSEFVINVSTQFITEALPILPVVFFESQAISLSFRYHQVASAREFDLESVAPRTTAVHRDILNILGERMTSMSSTSIRLRGTADPTTEGGDCELARNRAQAVKNYLVRVWKIDESRITIETGTGSCAPERPTRQQSESGYSENRRVEIVPSDVRLLGSVAKRRFNEARTVDPPKIAFDPTGTSQNYITDWSLQAMSGSTVLFSQTGKGVPEAVTQTLTTAVADAMQHAQPIDVTLRVGGIRNASASATTLISVRKDTVSTELERLTLTLFDIASDQITPIAQQQIATFIENLPAGSTVIVRGFADMLGNADFNKKLSQKRADAVCGVIRANVKKRVDLQCNEIRTDRFPPGIDSYETPEERFLSRTVQIEVKRGR